MCDEEEVHSKEESEEIVELERPSPVHLDLVTYSRLYFCDKLEAVHRPLYAITRLKESEAKAAREELAYISE